MIKAVIFDMGGVVIPLDMKRCIDNFRNKAGFKDVDQYLDAWHQKGFIGDMEAGKIGEEEFYEACLEHCAPGTDRQTVYECFSSLLDGINDGAVRLFRELKGKYPLYVLSNNNPISMKAFDSIIKSKGLTMEDVFDKVFFSYQLKMLKPAREFYLAAIEGTGVKPGEILFIDDSKTNTDAAEELGIKTLLYIPSEHNLYERVIERLCSENC